MTRLPRYEKSRLYVDPTTMNSLRADTPAAIDEVVRTLPWREACAFADDLARLAGLRFPGLPPTFGVDVVEVIA